MRVRLDAIIRKAPKRVCGSSSYPVLSITKDNGLVLQSDRFKKQIASVDQSKYLVVERGQLVLSIHLDEGVLAIQDIVDEGIVSPAYKIWNVNTEIVRLEYLELLLKAPQSVEYYKSKAKSSVAGRCNISDKELLEWEIEIPSFETQDKELRFIEIVRHIINHRQQELIALDDLIKARFVEMFGSPKPSWPSISIGDICTDTRTGPFGSALHHDEFVDDGIFVLGIDNAVENRFSYNRMRYITEEKYQQLKRYTVHPGDVIITIMGTIGRSAVIPADMPLAINTKHLACLTPDYTRVDSVFLCSAFQMHPDVQRQLTGNAKGAIMDGLNLGIIKGLRFQLPPLQEQKNFEQFYAQVDKSKVVAQKALDEAQLLFDSLMQKYFG